MMLSERTELEMSDQPGARLTKIRHLAFYACMALFWLTLVLNNLVGLGIPVSVFLIYAVAVAVVGDRSELIALAICCIPFSSSLQYKYVLLILAGAYLIRFFRDFGKIKLWTLFALSILLWEGLHGATLGFSLVEYFRGFAELILCIVIFSSSYRDYRFSLIRRMLALSTAVVCSIIFFNLLREGSGVDSFFSGYYRFGQAVEEEIESFDGTFNPNELGFICNLSIVGLLQGIHAREGKPLDLALILLLTLYGFLTLSRSFLICFALIIVLFLFVRSKNIFRTMGTVAGGGVGAGLIYWIYVSLFPNAYSLMIARWEVEDVSGGRLELFSYFHKLLFSSFSNMFFGIGLQNVKEKLRALYGGWLPPHNGIQEILVVWGLPGLILMVCWIWALIRDAKRYGGKLRLVHFLPFILVFVKMQTGQFVRSGTMMLSLTLVFLSLYQIFPSDESGLLPDPSPEEPDPSTDASCLQKESA